LIQYDMTSENLAREAASLLNDASKAAAMREDLAAVRAMLTPQTDPFDEAASVIAAELAAQRN
jgi:lipid A disaccharide synthetase